MQCQVDSGCWKVVQPLTHLYDAFDVLDELFDECNGMGELRWYDICDSENESSEEEESSSGDSSGDDYMSDG
ncbi:hypothetical protein KXD40_002099 [Peronospora effusa]|uniref:Uncharacterized protein n=1 Tax=Peronospora effusa TaxID=542832 RepID=A0A3M6VEJ8_9STRA|nr:hypothetical protein DD238_006328 [Peronospora effusa]RQM13355.1 hypothetical protein DD237_005218 [Peronospora effusa]UIZ26825.1 hypothetical protein KXD40_002099 [Peronospora effusa]